MRDFELNRTFDRIILPFRVIQYCPDVRDIPRVLTCIARHLGVGGKALLNILPLDPSFAAKWQNRIYSETFAGPDGATWRKEDWHDFDLEKQLLKRTVRFYRGAQLCGTHDESIVWLRVEQATELCRAAGIEVEVLSAPNLATYSGLGEYCLEGTLVQHG